VNLSRAEPRESVELVNDYEVELPTLDIIKELGVDLPSVGISSAGDDLWILLNVFDTETLQVFVRLVELPRHVLF
jgi:hypothetical protein